MTRYPHHQRLLDLLKSLDLTWPDKTKFVILFNNDVNAGLVSDELKTVTVAVQHAYENKEELCWELIDMSLSNLPVGRA